LFYDKTLLDHHLSKAQHGYANCVAVEYFEQRIPRWLSPLNLAL
jgi:hypothetical protein